MAGNDTNKALEELLGGGGSDAADWRDYLQAIRERFWIVLLCIALGGIGGAIYLNRQEVKFQARSVLFIEQGGAGVLDNKMQSVGSDEIRSLDMINTLVDLLQSYPFALRVAERLKLAADPRFTGGEKDALAAPMTTETAAGRLRSQVSVGYRVDTRLIDIISTASDPSLATEIANAYADEYIRYGFEQRSEANKAASSFLVEEADRLRSKMRVSEEAMQSFRERERAASLENMQESSQARLAETAAAISALEEKSQQLDNDLQQAAAKPDDIEALLRLPSVAAQPKVAQITASIADQERDLTVLGQRYRAKHPAFRAAQTQLQSLNANREELLHNVVSLLKNERERLTVQVDELKNAKEVQETRLLSVTGKYVEYNDLKRNLETDRAMYDAILNRMKEVDVTKGLTDSPVRIHERASGAGRLVASPTKIIGSGLFLGLALGLAFPLGLHFLDPSIKTVDQAEKITESHVLAAVPRKPSKEAALDSASERDGVVAEAFRSLRTSIAMVPSSKERRTFLFTSALPSEGKTFCSSNFSITLAQQGFTTLLIDADLRKPRVSTVFFGEHRKPGLGEVLAGNVTFSEAIQPTDIEGLNILTAGGRAPNPSELLSLETLPAMLAEALLSYDRVVIDTAPILAVSDGLLIAAHVDAVCLVLRAFKTPRKNVARAIKALKEINCEPAGTILNFLPTGSGSYHYYSGRYYGSYNSKGVYGAKA